jgi:hypothetical protein
MMNRMDNNKEEFINAITGASRESAEACDGKTKALPEATEACPEVTHAWLEEEKESTPKETDAVEEPQVVPEGATDKEEFGATEDRTGEQHLAIRRHRQRKERAQENGGPWQKFAAFRRWFTCCAIPALLKGHVRKGPRRSHRNGVRRPGRASGTRIVKRDRHPAVGYRSPLKRRTKVTVVQGAPEGRTDDKKRRTRPECNSGIQRLSKTSGNGKRGRTEKRRLERMEADREIIRRSLRL